MIPDVPPLPRLPAEDIERHRAVHEDVAVALRTADPLAASLFRFVQMRLLLEALATVTPILPGSAGLLFPPRRRFLTPAHRARLDGCRMALRHIDARHAMVQMGHLEHVLDPETPMVVNAFAESGDPSSRETNPGIPRATSTGFDPTESDFRPPDGRHCRRLLLDAVDVATHAPAPAIARAGWLAMAVFAIHPFVDGNGRVARLLFQAVNSSGLPDGFDWGSLEQWARDRRLYLTAIQTVTSIPEYDATRLDPTPFMQFALQRSVDGAVVCRRRLEVLGDYVDHLRSLGRPDDAILVEGVVTLDRNVHLDDLRGLPVDHAEIVTWLRQLHTAGVVRYDDDRGWNLAGRNPFAGVEA